MLETELYSYPILTQIILIDACNYVPRKDASLVPLQIFRKLELL